MTIELNIDYTSLEENGRNVRIAHVAPANPCKEIDLGPSYQINQEVFEGINRIAYQSLKSRGILK